MSSIKHQLLYFDLLRVIASQAVVVGHALNIVFAGRLTTLSPDGVFGEKDGVFYVATMGVVIFFVLSGFLVSGSVRRYRDRGDRGDGGFETFMVQRATRLLVPLIPAVLITFLVDRFAFAGGLSSPYTSIDLRPWTLLSNLLLLQDNASFKALEQVLGLDVARGPVGSNAALWTVALEWWIYVVFGMVMFGACKSRRWRAIALVPLLFAAFAVGATLVISGRGLILAWIVGAACAWWSTSLRKVPVVVHAATAAGSTVAAVGLLLVRDFNTYDPVVDTLSAIAVMAAYYATSSSERRADPRLHRVVSFASDYSYSLYLIHLPVIIWIATWSGDRDMNAAIELAVLVVASNVAGIALWWLAERHHLRVRDVLLAALARRRAQRHSGPKPAGRAGLDEVH